CCSPEAAEWGIPRQIDIGSVCDVPAAACEVAGHVEARVAGILSIEHPSARSDHPLGARIPGNAEPGRKVCLVVGDQPVAKPAVPRNLDRGLESDGRTFVKIPRSLAHESWVTAHVCDIRSRIYKRHLEVDQIPGQVEEWRRVLVSESVVDRDFRVDLPRVVDVVGLARCTELGFRKRYGSLGLLFVAKQKVCESVSCVCRSNI